MANTIKAHQPDRLLLSMSLIAKNEAHNIDRCFSSWWDSVDEVVVVDTGSTDGTIAEIKRYAARKKAPKGKLKIAHFDWIDDFAAARQHADSLVTGAWHVWCDLDDEIRGMPALREYAASASDNITAFFCRYRYASDQDGNPISELWRERLVRNDGTRWEGRLHEHKLITHGQIVKVAPDVAEWVHHRDHTQRTGERNLRILYQWLTDSPDDPRVVQSLAMELMGEQRPQDASDMFERYLQMPGEPPDRRAQAARSLGVMLMLQNRPQDARQTALQALAENWLWADNHLTLAEAEQTLGRPDVAIVHAETAMRIGQPDTLLIVNPLQYTAHARAIIAVCLAQMGEVERAVSECEAALAIAPHYPLAVAELPRMRAQLKKHHAIGSMLAMAGALAETGELLKARALLDQAPWYVTSDPQIVGRRADVHRLISERMADPPPLAEDGAADAFVARQTEAA